MDHDNPCPRRRGRPPKPRPEVTPRHPPLPFQSTRDRLAKELRRPAEDTGQQTVATRALVEVATTGLVQIERTLVGPLGHPFRFELTPDQLAAAEAAQKTRTDNDIRGLSANSMRTRASDWLTWLAFCAHYDRCVLPARFDDVAEFVRQLIAAGRKKATIEHILWSIANVHTRHRLMDPMASPDAKDFWRDRLREDLSGEQHQAAPLRKAMLKKLVAALEASTAPTRKVQHRLRQSVIDAQARRRLRDIAMLHVAYDLMTRSSELVALEWGRLSPGHRGGGTYRFRKTKTDQVGKGTECYLRPETMLALNRWRDASPVGGYIFHQVSDDTLLPLDKADDDKEREAWAQRKKRGEAKELAKMSAREVGTVFRRACDVAGVDLSRTWLSGHSARVGAAQDMARADLSTVQIMLAGRWRSERMPFHYAAQLKAEQHGEERHRRVDEVEDSDEAD